MLWSSKSASSLEENTDGFLARTNVTVTFRLS
jgi:hypothetical protein